MKNTTELQLRKLALMLTAVVVLQVVWSGARLWLLSEPAPIFPAQASLRVDDLQNGSEPADEPAPALDSRPVFWQGRQAHVPPADTGEDSAPVDARGSNAINKVTLQGIYTGARPGIIISYNGERRRLQLDDAIEGWTFTMMSPDGAIFESGSDSRTLQLAHALPDAKAAVGAKETVGMKTVGGTKAADGVSDKRDATDNNEKTGE